ncbi:MAG: hypothetical protein LKE40_06620 [Spirochaetia bacterium]|jgi:hypothetical protein|nr:hypothetical protein [Spirochaetia bacterium]
MGKNQTFLSEPEETHHGKYRHLRVVITDADENRDYLVVSITTWHEELPGQDDSCILSAGCHPFITHKSWVDYSRSRVMNYMEIFNGIQKGLLIRKEDMPVAVIALIQEGAEKTDFLPEEFRRFFDYF